MTKRFCDVCGIELTADDPGCHVEDGTDYCDGCRPKVG